MSHAPRAPSISAPLFLVSEVQRSGGSMMAQLFDGHPQTYAHPFEIQIGHPKKWFWPALDLAEAPENWFDRLFEQPIQRFIDHGYAKGTKNPHVVGDRRPFRFDIAVQREAFVARVTAAPPARQRAILDAYFSSFFAAWQDWSGTGRERCVTGFTPALISVPASVEGFFADYPDGRLITIVRDPRSWWVSARKHHEAYVERDQAMAHWMTSAAASLRHAAARPKRVLPLTYERLVREPEATMRGVAAFLGLDFDPILLTPTFLGQPVRPNSSFAVDAFGIGAHGLDRSAELTPEDLADIETRAMPLYAKADARAGKRLAAL